LEDGEEIEIELRRKGAKEHDILRYVCLLKDLSEEEERLLQEALRKAYKNLA
jgi:hypothetical protein